MFRFCSLVSGSSGNCQFVQTDNVRVLIDAGLSGIKIQRALQSIDIEPDSINAIFVTHEHSDHIKGVGILSRRFNIPIYANERTWDGMKNLVGKIPEDCKRVLTTGEKYQMKDMIVSSFNVYHDANEPVGYIFNKGNKKISYLTDTGIVTDDIKNLIKNSNLTLIESNHDIQMLKNGRYPYYLKKRILSDHGHLSNDTCGNVITEVYNGGEAIYLLGHLSQENNVPELAFNTVTGIVKKQGIPVDKEVTINMTYRDRVGKLYNIE